MDTPTRDARRPPRTFELRGAEWVQHAAPRRVRPPLWLIVPVAFVALAGIVLIVFAALIALATGGLVGLRDKVVEQSARLRGRLAALLRR